MTDPPQHLLFRLSLPCLRDTRCVYENTTTMKTLADSVLESCLELEDSDVTV